MSNTMRVADGELQKLTDTGLELADPAQDIRGRGVIDRDGSELGHVSALFIDAGERKVRMLDIRTGGLLGIGGRHALLPVDSVVRVTPDAVHVDRTREHVARSPAYDPAIVPEPTRQYWEPYFGYYGLSPYWSSGYLYPGFPISLEQSPIRDEADPHRRDL